jgi:hypothetical protein
MRSNTIGNRLTAAQWRALNGLHLRKGGTATVLELIEAQACPLTDLEMLVALELIVVSVDGVAVPLASVVWRGLGLFAVTLTPRGDDMLRQPENVVVEALAANRGRLPAGRLRAISGVGDGHLREIGAHGLIEARDDNHQPIPLSLFRKLAPHLVVHLTQRGSARTARA